MAKRGKIPKPIIPIKSAVDVSALNLEQLFAETQADEGYGDKTYARYKEWIKNPPFNPTQLVAFNEKNAKWILLYGERGTGKTWIALHKAIDHAFLEKNALVVLLTQTTTQAREGGIWDIFLLKVLPMWKKAIGLEASEPGYDPLNRKPFVWIRNRYGTGSKVICLSFPVEANIHDRVKAIEPSYAIVDEAQNFKQPDLFMALSQQLGRRSGIKGTQQLIFCANPAGTSHPLYKRFWIYAVDEKTGEWNKDYCRIHIPKEENMANLPKDYYTYIKEAVRGDPIEEARMIHGLWVDRPSGRAIFGPYFNRMLHVRGDAANGIGLTPIPGYPIRVGYDLGPVHSSVHFLQVVPTKTKQLWLVFDELNTVGKYVPYKDLVPLILRKMNFWEEFLKKEDPSKPVVFDHISDSSAFTHYRTDGSFDVMVIERESRGEDGIPRIRLKAAPKGSGSVRERIRILTDKLICEEILVSALCQYTINMFELFEAKAGDDPDKLDPVPSVHKHVFDSLTYPMIFVETHIEPITVARIRSPTVTWKGKLDVDGPLSTADSAHSLP